MLACTAGETSKSHIKTCRPAPDRRPFEVNPTASGATTHAHAGAGRSTRSAAAGSWSGCDEVGPLGHYCWVCGRSRANEKFSGKGHARHICKDCARLPREQRDRAQALRDIQGFLGQRNISAGNIARLKRLRKSPDEEIQRQAALLLEVAKLAPHKRGRIACLATHAPELLDQLAAEGVFLH